VNKDLLLNLAANIFSFGDDQVKVYRKSKIEAVVSNSKNSHEISFKYLEKEKRLDIAQIINNHKETILIPASSIERVEINIVSFAFVYQIFDSVDINDAIGTMMLSPIEESDLKVLGKDKQFMSHLKSQREIYNANCNKLLGYNP
jgi:hypothetical protein